MENLQIQANNEQAESSRPDQPRLSHKAAYLKVRDAFWLIGFERVSLNLAALFNVQA